MRHIYIANVSVEVPKSKPDKGYEMEGPEVFFPHNVFPSAIVGLPSHLIEDVVLENIKIDYEGGGNKDSAFAAYSELNKIPENSGDYPEFSMFGEMPAWGFYVRHAKGITFKNVQLNIKNPDYRVATIFDDVYGLELTAVKISAPKAEPVIVLNNVKQFTKNELQLPVDEKKGIKILQ